MAKKRKKGEGTIRLRKDIRCIEKPEAVVSRTIWCATVTVSAAGRWKKLWQSD